MKPQLWIVEMWSSITGKFEPTCGASLTRDDGRRDMKRWKENNPHDTFRLVKYSRKEKP